MRLRLVRLSGALCTLSVLAFLSVPASAHPSQLSILIDADSDLGTGCSVSTPDGPFAGVDERLDVTLETFGDGTAEVQSVRRQSCAGGTFGSSVVVDDSGWPVGLGLGEAGRHVVEAYVPLADLGAGADLRLAIVHVDGIAADSLLETAPGSGLPIVLGSVVDLHEIPTLSEWGALLLILLLVALALRAMRRREAVLVVLLCVAASVAGTVWAACVMDGLVDDWTTADRLAEDDLGEASSSVDLAAFFAKIEDGILCLRIDTDLQFNQPPTASAQSATTPEDTALIVTLTGSDPEGDALTFSITASPGHGTLGAVTPTGPASAQVTYSPAADYHGPDAFTFQVADGFGGTGTADVPLTVTAVNDAPTASSQSANAVEDVPLVITLLGADPDGDTLTFAIATGPSSGSLGAVTPVGPASAEVTYTPPLDFSGADSLTFTSSDGLLTSAVATVSITVAASDDAPVAVDDTATLTEDDAATTIDVRANDTDVDGGPMVVQSVTQPANGTVVVTNAGADLTYQPNTDTCNDGTPADTFTYTLGGGSTATVSVTVTCVDDAPVAVGDAETVAEDAMATALAVLTNDTDVDGGAISIAASTQPVNGTVVITGGGTGLTYQPDADTCNDGSPFDDFTYTLSPGGSTATASVTVTCVDDAPVAVDDAETVAEDSGATAVAVLANDTDIDAGPISVISVTQPASGTVAITGGGTGVSYAPNANYCNGGAPTDDFTYTLNGGSTATVAMTVTCVDDPPTAVADAATVGEDSGANALGVLANDVDPDAGPLMVIAVDNPSVAGGTVTITGGGTGAAYQPAADYCNDPPGTTLDTFGYTLNGGSTATVTVTVTCVNDAPQVDLDADDDKGTAGTDFALTFTEDDAARRIADPDDPLGAQIVDVDSATLASLVITLTNLLDTGEELLDADVSPFANLTKNYDVTTPGTGVLTITSATAQPVADYVAVLRSVTYRHTGDDPDAANRTIHVVADDGVAAGNTAVSTIAVVQVDDPPVGVVDAATVTEDDAATAVDVLANDTDADGGTKLVQSVTQPANGTVVVTGGGTGLTYQPDADYCNDGSPVDAFTYTLTPGGSSTTVSVTVNCVDDPPTAVADVATVAEDSGATAVGVLANDTDPDGGPISINGVTQPANGTVVITGGGTGLTYAPNADYCNDGSPVDAFTYTLTPGGSSTTVSVTVNCVDDPPTAVADVATVAEDSGATAVGVLANDTDPDGGPISINGVTQPANGTVVITGGGTGLTYAPNANYCNDGSPVDAFTYTLTPGGSSTTVSVTVNCVDDPPVAVADPAMVMEDSGATAVGVLANDTDPDGGPISITGVTQPANGTVVITGGGTGLTYTPNANYCNDGSPVDAFTYALTPGGSSTTVSVSVVCVNDPPLAGTDAYDFVGNTELRLDLAAAATPHALETTVSGFGVLHNDSDPVENDPLLVAGIVGCADVTAPFVCSVAGLGTVTMESNGRFSFVPAAGDADATESFQYQLSDGTDTVTGTVNLARSGRVWYVKNDAAPGGDGTSTAPFDGISAANLSDDDSDGDLADDVDGPGDVIFVYFGDGTSSGHDTGLVLEGGQRLLGEHVGLALAADLNGNGSPTVLVAAAAGQRPLLDDGLVDGFDGVSARNVVPAEVAGMSLSGYANALDWTTTAAFAGTGAFVFRDNVVRSAGTEGVDLNLGGTGALALAFHDNVLMASGNALDVLENGTGSLTITRFDDNVVSGNSLASGLVITNAVFDAVLGGGFDLVSGGTTAIGASGNGVGGSGMVWNGISGDILFTDLDVFADAGTGLRVGGTGASNLAGSGLRFRVGAGVGVVAATGGPAVDLSNLTADLQLASLASTNTTSIGVSLDGVADGGGTNAVFLAPSGSSVTTNAGASGPAFRVNGGNARIAYAGTITNQSTAARAVSVTSWAGDDATDDLVFSGAIDENGAGILLSGNGGARAITFSGGVDADTTTGEGFAAISNTNALGIQVTGSTNEIDSTSATALRVTSTRIGAAGLEFRRLSSGNATAAADPANGIVLSGTLSAATDGGLRVTGTGSAGSGGTIQNTTGTGIVLAQTANVSLAWMQVSHTGSHGLSGAGLVDETGGGSPTLSVRDSRFTSPGDGDNESALFFGTTAVPGNSTGRIVVADTIVEDFEENGFELANDTGTLAIEITGSLAGLTGGTTVFDDNDDVHGQHAVIVVSKGTAVTSLDVWGVYMDDIEAEAIMVQSTGTSSLDIDLIGNVSINGGGPDNFPSGGGFAVVQDGGAGATFDIQGNTIRDLKGDGVVIIADGPSSGRIGGSGAGEGNVISGTGAGDGIRIDTDQLPGGGDGFTATILVQNNQIGTDATFPGIADDGIQILHRDGNKTLRLTVEGNQIAGTGSEAIRIFTDADVSGGGGLPASSVRIVGNSFTNIGVSDATYFQTQDTAGMCLHLSNNTYVGGNRNISLNQQTTSVFQITQAGVAAVATDNPGSTVSSTGTVTGGGTCTSPPLPNHS